MMRGVSDESLDAVTAAPDHHTVLFENERVRVLEARVAPGDTVPLHTHALPGIQYLTSLADFVRRDADGSVMLDTRSAAVAVEAPLVVWSEPIPPHTLENVGERPIHAIVVEVKELGDPAP